MFQFPDRSMVAVHVRLIVSTTLLMLVSGCASVTSTPELTRAESGNARSARQAPRIESDGRSGFTVTEVVRIDSDVRNDYQRAVASLTGDRLDEGIALLESIVARAPEVTIPHIELGVAYGRLKEYDKAEQSLRTALSLAPNHPVALNELGILYRRTGRFDAARASYEQVLAIHPGFHFALLNLGVLCDLYLQDLTCALDNYQRYADIVTDDAQVGIWIADLSNRLASVQ